MLLDSGVNIMITVLSGGTGTPKLLQGIKEIVDPKKLSIIVNTLENDYFQAFMFPQILILCYIQCLI